MPPENEENMSTDALYNKLVEIDNNIATKTADIKNVAEDAVKQAKNAESIADTVKNEADKRLTELGEQKTQLASIANRIQDMEQAIASNNGGGRGGADLETLGQGIANHADVREFAKNGSKGTIRFELNNVITTASTSAGPLIDPDRVAGATLPRRPLRLRDLLNVGRTTSGIVEFARMKTRDNQAAPVAETMIKPESNYEWEFAQTPVQTIAHWVHVSRQAMDDAAQLQSEIDGELRYGLDLEEENQLFAGDGIAPNLAGLTGAAGAYTAPITIAGATPIDTVRLAALQAELADYPVDGFMIHPLDWAEIQLTKDSDGRYIVGNPFAMMGGSLWGYSVISSRAPAPGSFMVGNWMTAATIYDRMDTEVLISSEDRDNFIKNMLTVRAEKRLALAIKRPEALIAGTF